MKTRIFKLVLIVVTFQFFGCKNEAKLPEFKYADKPATITCNANLDALLKEAVYSFESDIAAKYDPNGKNLYRAYRSFLGEATNNRAKYETIVSEHSKQLFEALKAQSNLWNLESTVSNLNYTSDLVTCLGENMKDKGLQTTFKSLISVNSMSPSLFGAPLISSPSIMNDKYLGTFVALEYYYAKLFNADLTNVKAPENKDLNKTDTTIRPENLPEKKDPHAGHNHD